MRTLISSFFIVNVKAQIANFVGLENYHILFSDYTFLRAITNTLVFALITVPTSVIIGFVLAVLARGRRSLSSIYETAFSFPIAISSSVIAMIFQLLYMPSLGILNKMFGCDIHWLSDEQYSLLALAIIQIWMFVGYNFIFSLTAMRSISKEITESASLDGASIWSLIMRFFIPLTLPTQIYLLFMNFSISLMMMSLTNILTSGGPHYSTLTVVQYMYSKLSIQEIRP